MREALLALVLIAALAAPAASRRAAPYVGAVSADSTGRVLFCDRADSVAYPASVTKLMTALIVVEDVRAGKYSFLDKVAATPDASKCEPSWVTTIVIVRVFSPSRNSGRCSKNAFVTERKIFKTSCFTI